MLLNVNSSKIIIKLNHMLNMLIDTLTILHIFPKRNYIYYFY